MCTLTQPPRPSAASADSTVTATSTSGATTARRSTQQHRQHHRQDRRDQQEPVPDRGVAGIERLRVGAAHHRAGIG